MKTLLTFLALALTTASAEAAVGEGENLLINGTFDAEQVEFPEFWSPSSAKNVLYDRSGGPEGKKAAVFLQSDGATPGTVSLRQQGLTLVAGETYRLSAWVKTEGFHCRSGGLIVHNSGWISATGITQFPADSEWNRYEKTFTLMESKGREYGVALYAGDMTGRLHITDVRLEAVSEGARKGSSSQASIVAAPRLVPLEPLLARIPRHDPRLVLKLFTLGLESRQACECLATVRGDTIPPQTIPLDKNGKAVVNLQGLPSGHYTLTALVRRRETGEKIVEDAWPIRLIDVPAIDPSAIRQLNTLVAELLNRPVHADPAEQSFTFVNPRDGWLFVAFAPAEPAARPAAELAIKIDGSEAVITAATDRLEAFRQLPMGEHRITVAGNRADARLVVRSIPEIFDYPPCTSSFVKENGSYGWDFMKKHVLPAVTTLNGGSLPGDALAESKALGLKWLANFGVDAVGDPEAVCRQMEKHPGMTEPQYDGITADELFFARASIGGYAEVLKRLQNPQDRLVYTWIVGKPSIASLHTDFMSAALNVSGGRGRLLFEAYCHPQQNEQAAAAYLDGMVAETMRRFNTYLPGAAAGTGIIFGNFNQIPIISLEHDPAVDFKYFLDMQVNLVANNPDFKNLATTGYWGTYYGDEELVRWSFLLMRHYAVEGNKEMLSARYGFKYNPGLLAGGDFAHGLEGWTPSPAAENSIRPATIAGYGKNSQGRWGGGSAGDTVCLMARQAGKPNRLTQTARGLQVGKAYCLQFVTADYQDVTRKRYNPRRYGLRAQFEGAEILPGRGYVHIDRRNSGRYEDNNNVAKINLNRIIFRAKAPELTVVFTDQEAEVGEELILNFVQLKPYLE
ncbi:MAG: carbohydrate binding domain-containing protein [Thermoguttaceae bacterium]